MKSRKFSFRVTIETEDASGRVLALYLQIREGKPARTREYADGNVFADYDRNGLLIGIEMLAPCKAAILDRIADQAKPKRFVRNAVPRGMLVEV
jgi:uncharacterized protein YuzE